MGRTGDRQTSEGREYCEAVILRLTPLEVISSKKMFGGFGLFQAGKMFGLITSDAELFLKVDDTNRSSFTRARAPQHGKMPYFRVPKTILADDSKFMEWVRTSIEVAHA